MRLALRISSHLCCQHQLHTRLISERAQELAAFCVRWHFLPSWEETFLCPRKQMFLPFLLFVYLVYFYNTGSNRILFQQKHLFQLTLNVYSHFNYLFQIHAQIILLHKLKYEIYLYRHHEKCRLLTWVVFRMISTSLFTFIHCWKGIATFWNQVTW
jgi:hypothetical protein